MGSVLYVFFFGGTGERTVLAGAYHSLEGIGTQFICLHGADRRKPFCPLSGVSRLAGDVNGPNSGLTALGGVNRTFPEVD